MVVRKGLGRGKGMGYKNMLQKDPVVHSMNSRGVRQMNKPLLDLRVTEPPAKPYMQFGLVPTEEKKGLIKEIARKAVDGVNWAVEWEKEHLPKQKEWVKDEFDKAKELTKRGFDNIKDKLEQKQKDVEDVRDELDIDDDGVQDIEISELEDVNDDIRQDLETIDLDDSGIPDYQETSPLDDAKVEIEPQEIGFLEPEVPRPKKKTVFASVNEFIEAKRLENEEVRGLSDKKLRELAIKEGRGFFGGNNKFENEIVSREREKIRISELIKKARQDERDRNKRGGVGILAEFLGLSPLPKEKR